MLFDLTELFASLAGFSQFAIAFVEDGFVAAFELVLGCDVADGAVQADVVVILDVVEYDATSVFERQWDLHADTVALESFVKAFNFAVGLGVIRRGLHVRHARDADELLEILGDELGTVVADEARRNVWVKFAGALDNGFHVDCLHFFADFVVDDGTAIAVENRTNEVERAGDIEIAEVDVPLLMGFERLHKAGAFLGDVGR